MSEIENPILKDEKLPDAPVVSTGGKKASKGKGKKSKSAKKKEKTEKQSFAGAAQARLAKMDKREKALTSIVEQRQKTLAKMTKNLDIFKVALEKCKKQKESELTAIKELTAIFSEPKA